MQRKARERYAQHQAAEALGRLDSRPVSDPLTALSALAGEILAWKDMLAERVAALKAVGYAGMTGEQVRADVAVYEHALDRAMHVLAAMAKLDIDERLAAIRERQLDIVANALAGAMADAGLPDHTRTEVVSGVASRLRLVESAG